MHKILKGPLHINLDAKIMIVPMHMHKTVRGTICIKVGDFIPFIISFPTVNSQKGKALKRQQHGTQTASVSYNFNGSKQFLIFRFSLRPFSHYCLSRLDGQLHW